MFVEEVIVDTNYIPAENATGEAFFVDPHPCAMPQIPQKEDTEMKQVMAGLEGKSETNTMMDSNKQIIRAKRKDDLPYSPVDVAGRSPGKINRTAQIDEHFSEIQNVQQEFDSSDVKSEHGTNKTSTVAFAVEPGDTSPGPYAKIFTTEHSDSSLSPYTNVYTIEPGDTNPDRYDSAFTVEPGYTSPGPYASEPANYLELIPEAFSGNQDVPSFADMMDYSTHLMHSDMFPELSFGAMPTNALEIPSIDLEYMLETCYNPIQPIPLNINILNEMLTEAMDQPNLTLSSQDTEQHTTLVSGKCMSGSAADSNIDLKGEKY